jgi:hypothetical protein
MDDSILARIGVRWRIELAEVKVCEGEELKGDGKMVRNNLAIKIASVGAQRRCALLSSHNLQP